VAAWPEPVERVAEVFRSAGVEARIEELPHGTPTARAAADALGCELGEIVKSVVMVCDGAYVLALVPGDRRADEAAVAGAVAAHTARLARPEEVVEATGFEPGGVAPFPHLFVAEVLLDRSLLGRPAVWIGAGTADHMAALTSVDLQRLAKARPVDLTSPGPEA
jgi:prolyl-tRNA editing enzyme YbaK/EbsC (Cys-tRNA(Pro) deacylase)